MKNFGATALVVLVLAACGSLEDPGINGGGGGNNVTDGGTTTSGLRVVYTPPSNQRVSEYRFQHVAVGQNPSGEIYWQSGKEVVGQNLTAVDDTYTAAPPGTTKFFFNSVNGSDNACWGHGASAVVHATSITATLNGNACSVGTYSPPNATGCAVLITCG